MLAMLSLALGAAIALPAGAQEVLPRPPQPFKGKIGRTAAESTPDFPNPIEAPKGAPNVLLILTDDVGWGSSLAERADVRLRPSLTRGRSTFTYYPGTIRVPEGAAPDLKNKSFTVTAEVEIPGGGAEGVLATQGGRFGGWGLFVMDGKPEFDYAFSQQPQHKYRVTSNEKLAPGKHSIKLDFKYDGPGFGKSGTGTLSVDGKQVAQGKIERTILTRFSLDETFDVAEDTGTPVVEDYLNKMPFQFTGDLKKVVVELGKSGLTASDEKKLEEANKKLAAQQD
jgi:arylsulfatase